MKCNKQGICYFLGTESGRLLLENKCFRMRQVTVLLMLCSPLLRPSGLYPTMLGASGPPGPPHVSPGASAPWLRCGPCGDARQRVKGRGAGEGGPDLPSPFLLSHRWAEAPLPRAAGWFCGGLPHTRPQSQGWLCLSPGPGTTPYPAFPA